MAYTRYTSDGTLVIKFHTEKFLHTNKQKVDKLGGWIEDEDGKVIHGRKPRGSIKLTPTWRGCLPLLLEAYTNGTEKGRAMAREELQRMADICDEYNALTRTDTATPNCVND